MSNLPQQSSMTILQSQMPRSQGSSVQPGIMQGKRSAEFPTESYQSAQQYSHTLRDLVSKAQPFSQVDGDHIKTQIAIKQLDEHSKLIESTYNEFEKFAKILPTATPITPGHPSLDTLNRFALEADSDVQNGFNFDRACDEYACTSYTNRFATIMKDYMQIMVPPPRRSVFSPAPPLPDFDITPRIRKQQHFERLLDDYVVTQRKKMLPDQRFSHNYLERTQLQCVVEILMVGFLNRCGIKFLLLVSEGNIDYINIYGISEDYAYMDNYRYKVDVFSPSKCELHAVWSKFLNSNYQQFACRENEVTVKITYIIMIMTKLNLAFNTPCKVCKELLKGGSLPYVVDLRAKSVTHEDCR